MLPYSSIFGAYKLKVSYFLVVLVIQKIHEQFYKYMFIVGGKDIYNGQKI